MTVKKLDLITVELTDNPTTGYQWLFVDKSAFDLDGHSEEDIILGLVHEEYVQDSKEFLPSDSSDLIVGRGGTRRFKFMALQTGQQKLELAYCRPWELRPLISEDQDIHWEDAEKYGIDINHMEIDFEVTDTQMTSSQ